MAMSCEKWSIPLWLCDSMVDILILAVELLQEQGHLRVSAHRQLVSPFNFTLRLPVACFLLCGFWGFVFLFACWRLVRRVFEPSQNGYDRNCLEQCGIGEKYLG